MREIRERERKREREQDRERKRKRGILKTVDFSIMLPIRAIFRAICFI